MAIQYAGGTRVNYTFTDAGTRGDLVSKLETQLGTAGWSTISGAGTGDVLMKSAVTAGGLSVRLRLYDPGSGNCAQFTIKNNAGTLTSQIFYLLPASVDWRIVASQYAFAMFKCGGAYRMAARAMLFGGTIWVPDYVLTVMGADLDCGYAQGAGTSDTDTTNNSTWRANIQDSGQPIRGSALFKSIMLNGSGGNAGHPLLGFPHMQSGSNSSTVPFEWEGAPRLAAEALVGWSPDGSTNTRPKYKGQLWDAMIIGGQFDGESTITYDGHTFIAITDMATADYRGSGTLFIAVD